MPKLNGRYRVIDEPVGQVWDDPRAAERSPEDSGEDADKHQIDPDSRAADPAGPDPDHDAGLDDPRSGKPAPPGNMNIGGGVTGGS